MIKYSKVQIVKGIEKLIDEGLITLGPEEKRRYDDFRQAISYEKFLEQNRGSSYDIDIEGIRHSIPIEEIMQFMLLSEKEFLELCSNSDIKNIYGIPKEHFIYVVHEYFFKDRVIFNNVLFPEGVVDRFNDIISNQKIDIEAINTFLKTTDTKFREVRINEDLEKLILSGMPEDASDLEKAIYIYIKMCKELTYDVEYYAVGQKGNATLKHKDVNYISTITPQHNEVVCFEFNLIYAKLLNDLGIKFSSYYKNGDEKDYGDGHANLKFRCGKFLVKADSVRTILGGDIARAKRNQPLLGLKCLNVNQQTQREFEESASKMYKLIAKQEEQEKGTPVQQIETFEELMSEYMSITTNIKDVSLEERVAILVNKVNSANMVGIDSLSYVLELRKVLFGDEEKSHNMVVSIIRNNEPIDQDRIATAGAVIALNEDGFEDFPEQSRYFYFSPNDRLIEIPKRGLQMRFDEGTFEYIYDKDPRIPGIVVGGGHDDRKTKTS